MFNRLLTGGGSIGFVLILLFGRSMVGYVTTPSDKNPNPNPMTVENQRARSLVRKLTSLARKSLVAVSRCEMEMERLAKEIAHTPIVGSHDLKDQLDEIRASIDMAKRELQVLNATRQRVARFVRQSESTEWENESSLEFNTLDIERAEELVDRLTESGFVEAKDNRLTVAGLHFMDEVSPAAKFDNDVANYLTASNVETTDDSHSGKLSSSTAPDLAVASPETTN